MISIYQLKPRFQGLLRPACHRLVQAGYTANQVTVAAVMISVVAGAWIALQPDSIYPYLALPLVLMLRMALNAIDGLIAREFNMQSPLGGMLNELGDIISDIALYLPLGFHPSVPWWTIIMIVLLALIVEMVGILGVQIGATRRYDGPFGKSDRAFAFGLLGILLGLGILSNLHTFWYLLAALGLSILTVINRARMALNELADKS